MAWFPKDENSPFFSIQNWWNNRVRPRVEQAWNDYTGNTAIDKQNAAQLALAKYQTQMQEEFYNKYSSPEALMRQYKEAGLNPNLVYGSASAGQGNVPSFSAPHVQRYMSGSDKLSKALSMVSQVAGVMQGVYQTSAAREAAQQSAVKTMNDIVSYKRNALDYILNSDLIGGEIGGPSTKLFRTTGNGINWVSGDLYKKYLGMYRESKFNDFLRPGAENYYNYGVSLDKYGTAKKSSQMSYYQLRNAREALRYRLNAELGNKGIYGKLAIGLLNTIF